MTAWYLPGGLRNVAESETPGVGLPVVGGCRQCSSLKRPRRAREACDDPSEHTMDNCRLIWTLTLKQRFSY